MLEQFDKVVSAEKTAVSFGTSLLAEPYLNVIQNEMTRIQGSIAGILPDIEIDFDDAPSNVCSDCKVDSSSNNCPPVID